MFRQCQCENIALVWRSSRSSFRFFSILLNLFTRYCLRTTINKCETHTKKVATAYLTRRITFCTFNLLAVFASRFELSEVKRKMNSYTTPRVLSIQSHVVHGYVGNKSAVFPLQVLGFEVDSINTVQFTTHTAYKHIRGTLLKDEELDQLIEGLELNEVDFYTHLLTGYSRSPDSLRKLAEIIKKLRQRNPNLVYVCDPVMGDNGKMYVPDEILPVYRDVVVPLADILTPNQFEAEQITGIKMSDFEGALKVIQALHDMGVQTVVLSSTELGDEKSMIGIASTAGTCYQIKIPKVDANFTGTGDLFAALFLAWFHKTGNNVKLTLEKTIATMQAIVQDTYQSARAIQHTGNIPVALRELRLIQNKNTIEDPKVTISAVEVKTYV